MIRAERRRIERTLRSYKSIPTNERLTASSGIGVLVEIFYKSPLFNEMMKHLPERLSHRSLGAGPLALTLIAGHLLGVESVEDLEEIRDDEFLMELFGDDVPAPRTLLDYLNDFEESHIDGLNQFLNIMSRTLHQMVIAEHPEVLGTDRIVDIDSTYHKHYGDLIEGVTWNYKNEWSLESQVAFNSLGFCHHLWVRPGNTKSGTYRAKQQDKLGIHLSHYGAGFKKYNKGVLGSPPICTSHLGILFFKVFTGGSTDKRSLHFSNSEVSGILWSWFGSEFEDARSYKDRGVSKSTFHVNTQAYWGLFFEVCNGKAGFGDIS